MPCQAVAVYAFNPSIQEVDRQISEFKASLVYRVSSRTARPTQRNPVLKNQKRKKKKKTVLRFICSVPLFTLEKTQQLRAWAALLGDPGSIPSTHTVTHNCL